MYRVLKEIRAQRLLEQPLDYTYNPVFDDPAMTEVIMGPMPDAEAYESNRKGMRVPKDAPPELASLYEVPLLNKEQEQHLFRKMNYLKHKAAQLRKRIALPGGGVNIARVRTHD